jgi:hypothetical protein
MHLKHLWFLPEFLSFPIEQSQAAPHEASRRVTSLQSTYFVKGNQT